MPPKRKRAAEEAATETTTTAKKRATKASSTSSSRKTRGAAAAAQNNATTAAEVESVTKAASRTSLNESSPTQKQQTEPEYSDARVAKTFAQYADPEDAKKMTMDGMGRLFEDAGVSLEGVGPFLLAWMCQAEDFGEITSDQWNRLKQHRVDTPTKLKKALDELEHSLYSNTCQSHSASAQNGKKQPKAPSLPTPPHDYGDAERVLSMQKQKFKDFYMFCFGLMKKSEARVLQMEFANAVWSVVLQPKFPIVPHLLEFIEAHPSYKAVNKDLWTMTLEFCYAVQSRDLMTWNDDECWPSMLDEFVAWEKARRPAQVADVDVEML